MNVLSLYTLKLNAKHFLLTRGFPFLLSLLPSVNIICHNSLSLISFTRFSLHALVRVHDQCWPHFRVNTQFAKYFDYFCNKISQEGLFKNSPIRSHCLLSNSTFYLTSKPFWEIKEFEKFFDWKLGMDWIIIIFFRWLKNNSA